MSSAFNESVQSLDGVSAPAIQLDTGPLRLSSLDLGLREHEDGCEQTRGQVEIVTDDKENVHGQTRSTNRVGNIQTPKQPTETSQQAAKIFPNNTLVEDLTRCHEHLWPGVARATIKLTQLVSSCWAQLNPFAMARSRSQRMSVVEFKRQRQATKLANNQTNKEKQEMKRTVRFPMPNSILRLNSTLTQDDYNRALCILTSDIRYKLHILLFRRLQTVWTLFNTFVCVLIPMLTLTGLSILTTISTCFVWLILQVAGFAMCKHARKQLDRMLERSVAQANSFFMDHKLMLGVINVGSLMTQSRFVVPLLYFDAFQCIERIESLAGLNQNTIRGAHDLDRRSKQVGAYAHLQPIQRVFAQTQFAKRIVLNYSQRWISQFDKSKLLLSDDGSRPRHLSTGKCLCQFIEENLEGAANGIKRQLDRGDEIGASAEIVRSQKRQTVSTETRNLDGENNMNETIISIPGEPVGLKTNSGKQEPVVRSRLVKPMLGASLTADYNELSVASLIQTLKQQDDLSKSIELAEFDAGNLTDSGKAADTYAGHLQHDEERTESGCSPETELSLDLDSECFAGRNEELFKSLKLLLDLRSNELSMSLDEISAATVKNRSSLCSSYTASHYEQRQKWQDGTPLHSDTSDGEASRQKDGHKHKQNVSTDQIGDKGFFARVDTFFSVGFKRNKHKGFYGNSAQQIIEIC